MKKTASNILKSKGLTISLSLIFLLGIGTYIYLEKAKSKVIIPQKKEVKVYNTKPTSIPNQPIETKPIEKDVNKDSNFEVFIAQSGGHDSGNAISRYIYSIAKIENGRYKKIDKSCMNEKLYNKYSTELPGIIYSQHDFSDTLKTVINDKKVLAQVFLVTKIATDKTMETSNRTEVIDLVVEKINDEWIITSEERKGVE